MNNKFIKFLIILNGVMLPIFLGFGIYQLVKDFYPRQEITQQRGLSVSDDVETSENELEPLQGLNYSMPDEVYNSTNFLLKVYIEDYTKDSEIVYMYDDRDSYFQSYSNLVNVIFLDKDRQVIRTLLDKKASIKTIGTRRANSDIFGEPLKSYSTITYKIAFEDTNKDGKLNENDDHDLYVSNLSGGDLTQITKGIEVKGWIVYHEEQVIMIRYSERVNKEKKDQEEQFAVYSIKDKTLKPLNGLNNELQKLRATIAK
jgi:hypothetical protein